MQKQNKHGKIAFITTLRFRKYSPETIEDFVYSHLYWVCSSFKVITTGGTGNFLKEIINCNKDNDSKKKIQNSMGIDNFTNHDLDRWRETINQSLEINGRSSWYDPCYL